MPSTTTLPDTMRALTKAQHQTAHGIQRKPKRGRARRNAKAWSAAVTEFIAKTKAKS